MKKHIILFFAVLCICCPKGDATIVAGKKILPHPRLLFSKQDEQAIKKQIKKTPLLQELQGALIEEADKIVEAPLQIYQLDPNYGNILYTSREEVRRIVNLALAYRLTGNRLYLQKAEKELINVCNFTDWDPPHFLDTAEMTTAVAIGYDWLYKDLQESTKSLIRESIKTKALNYVVEQYAKGSAGSWAKRETNWNVVCNSGMVLGVMAIAEEVPDLAEHIVLNAVKYVPNCLKHFAPDGACYEGPAYWGYTNIYLSLLLSTLNMNFQSDFGLSELEGISKAALFCIHTTSPSGHPFNFADASGSTPYAGPIYSFFGKHFNQPEVAATNRKLLSDMVKEKNFSDYYFFLTIPWFDNTTYAESREAPKLRVYKSINDIAVFKGNPQIPNAIYLAAKGGEPAQPHQHMDIGTFVVEANGIRWGDDLGADNYALPGFWGYKGPRWQYIRNSSLGHNTLSINGEIQSWEARGKITNYIVDTPQPSCTIDMTAAYPSTDSALRTFTLLDDSAVLLTDSLHLASAQAEVTWNMMTTANIDCKGNVAALSKDGKVFYLKVLSPANAVFTSKVAHTSTKKEFPLVGYKHLQVKVTGNQTEVIKIKMSSVAPIL